MDRFDSMFEFAIMYLLFGVIVSAVYKMFNRENRKLQLIDAIICLVLVFVSAIRINTGSDFYSYYFRYNTIPETYNSAFEVFTNSRAPLFDVLCYFTNSLGFGQYGIFQLSSVLFYIPLIIFLRKHSDKPYAALSVLMFSSFFLITNNILKHTYAMFILFYAYNGYLRKGKNGKFILLSLLASLFHPTVLVASIILIVSKKIQPSYRKLVFFNMLGISILILLVLGMFFVKRIMGIEHIQYIDDNYAGMVKQTICVLGYVIFYNIICFYLIKHKKNLQKEIPDSSCLISALMIAVSFSIISMIAWPLNRFSIYIYFFAMQLVPTVFRNETRFNKVFLASLYCIWCVFAVITSGDNEYYNYDTYLDESKKVIRPRDYIKTLMD